MKWKHDLNSDSDYEEGSQSLALLSRCVETCCWLWINLVICHAISWTQPHSVKSSTVTLPRASLGRRGRLFTCLL